MAKDKAQRKQGPVQRGSATGHDEAARALAQFFRRGGYVRWRNPARLRKEGYARYKKGDEARFVADTEKELWQIQSLLREVGIEPGKPFAKGNKFRQPVYGYEPVMRLLEIVDGSRPT